MKTKSTKGIATLPSPPGCIATPESKAIARYIFSHFDNGKDKCQRLAARGGSYPDSETNLGGLCELAFAEMIEQEKRDRPSRCVECRCEPPGHKINCKTGNRQAGEYQKLLKKRYKETRRNRTPAG